MSIHITPHPPRPPSVRHHQSFLRDRHSHLGELFFFSFYIASLDAPCAMGSHICAPSHIFFLISILLSFYMSANRISRFRASHHKHRILCFSRANVVGCICMCLFGVFASRARRRKRVEAQKGPWLGVWYGFSPHLVYRHDGLSAV